MSLIADMPLVEWNSDIHFGIDKPSHVDYESFLKPYTSSVDFVPTAIKKQYG